MRLANVRFCIPQKAAQIVSTVTWATKVNALTYSQRKLKERMHVFSDIVAGFYQ